jgi:hypothetical protein
MKCRNVPFSHLQKEVLWAVLYGTVTALDKGPARVGESCSNKSQIQRNPELRFSATLGEELGEHPLLVGLRAGTRLLGDRRYGDCGKVGNAPPPKGGPRERGLRSLRGGCAYAILVS